MTEKTAVTEATTTKARIVNGQWRRNMLPASRNIRKKVKGARCIVVDPKTKQECGKDFSTSTTNLWRHVEKAHRIQDEGHVVRPSTARRINPQLKEEIDRALVRWVYHDFQAFRVVSNKYFRRLLKKCHKNYEPPGRKAISRDIKTHFFEARRQLKDLLQDTGSKIALKTGYWSAINRLSFLVVTAHWFSPDHETFFNCVLDFVRIEHPHDGETTFKALKKITDTSA
ncbi:hypothetical protein RvY_16297 [Ramazzottius varieornatus]|uniref:BED-type domain-containing protein n=1 Tax=Ramazzottius varieornatus TaxID=947166 RepID=A0A1D1VXY6_RAMVA|nr:hypothetical protein RvY_16297 [Ramazzottius varieornatus]